MIPESVLPLFDTSARGLFLMMNHEKLFETSMAELEIGFRQMKEKLDAKNMDFRVLIFEIDSDALESDDEFDDKDSNQIKLGMSAETLAAIPLMKEEFVERIE